MKRLFILVATMARQSGGELERKDRVMLGFLTSTSTTALNIAAEVRDGEW